MTYTGLCVGGPFDGKSYTSDAPFFYAMEMPEAPARYEARPDYNRTGTKVLYEHHASGLLGGLWVPEGEGVQWAADELLRHYHLGSARSKLSADRLKSVIKGFVTDILPVTIPGDEVAREIADAVSSLFEVEEP